MKALPYLVVLALYLGLFGASATVAVLRPALAMGAAVSGFLMALVLLIPTALLLPPNKPQA